MFDFEIEGNPVPWKAHAGYGKRSFNPRFEEKQYYQHEIKKQYHQNFPLTVAVKIDYSFCMPIPSSFSKKKRAKILEGRGHHVSRPDTTNLQKFVEDTLKDIVIKDDSQVVECCSRKFYSENPRTIIHIELA